MASSLIYLCTFTNEFVYLIRHSTSCRLFNSFAGRLIFFLVFSHFQLVPFFILNSLKLHIISAEPFVIFSQSIFFSANESHLFVCYFFFSRKCHKLTSNDHVKTPLSSFVCFKYRSNVCPPILSFYVSSICEGSLLFRFFFLSLIFLPYFI